jgi:hypothetical protein
MHITHRDQIECGQSFIALAGARRLSSYEQPTPPGRDVGRIGGKTLR